MLPPLPAGGLPGAALGPFLSSFQHQVCLFMYLLSPTRAGPLASNGLKWGGLYQVESKAGGAIREKKTPPYSGFKSVKSNFLDLYER